MKRAKRQRSVFLSSTRTRPRMCPVCKMVLDGATGMQADSPLSSPHPQPGNITLCGNCVTVLIVTEDGFRLAEESELARLDPDMRRILMEVQQRIVTGPPLFGRGTSNGVS